MKTGPMITVARLTGAAALKKRVAKSIKLSAYVGIPASGKARQAQLVGLAGATKSSKRRAKLVAAAVDAVNNAELLYLFSKGSPANNQPPRPVLEPAVEADGNRQAIANELAAGVKASTHGDADEARRRIRRAGLAGQNAARKWFTDPRNNWAPNAPSTIAGKGSDRPGINTGAMRAAITSVVSED